MFRLAAFLFCLTIIGMIESSRAQELGVTADEVARDPSMWPHDVMLKKRTQVKLGTVGDATYEAGTRVTVLRVTRDSVVVQLAGREATVPMADTNLLELASASFSGARARQRLIDEANTLPPIPGSSTTATPIPTPTPTTSLPQDNGLFSDNFRDPTSLSRWTRLSKAEGRDVDVMESVTYGPYGLTLVPFSCAWFNEFRSELFYQPVQGDFIIRSFVGVSGRGGPATYPSSQFSLAGLMLRIPRSPADAAGDAPGKENYVFVGVGVGADVNQAVVEYKTTFNSISTVRSAPCHTTVSHLMIARVGDYVFVLVKPLGVNSWSLALKGEWESNVPDQVGFTAYTDYPRVERASVERHNHFVLRNGNPDLRATFSSVKLTRPRLDPAAAAKISSMNDKEVVELLTAGLDQ